MTPSQEAPSPVTAAVSEGGASPFEEFLKVVGLLDRPRNAYFTGFNAYDQAVKRGDLPASNKYVPLGALSSALFSKQFWQGFGRGLAGQEKYTGADVLRSDFPQFAEKHPTATQWLGTGIDLATDPTVIGGAALSKPTAAVLRAGTEAAIGMPGITQTIAQTVPPALQAAGRFARPYVKFGAPSTVGRFLRQSRAGISTAGKEGSEEALAIGDNLTPEMEREARRLLERPISAEVRERLAAKTGGKVPSAVDVALSEAQEGAEQAARASTPAARRFRPQNPALTRLNRVMERSQELAKERGVPAGTDSFDAPAGLRRATMTREAGSVESRLQASQAEQVKNIRDAAAQMARERTQTNLEARKAIFDRVLQHGKIRPYEKGYLGEDFVKKIPRALRSKKAAMSLDQMADALGYESDEALARDIERAASLRRVRPEEVLREAENMILGTDRGKKAQDTIEALKSLRQSLGESLEQVEKEMAGSPSAEAIAREAAAEMGVDLDTLFAAAEESPIDLLRRLAERSRLGRVAGVGPDAPVLARPGTIVPNVQADPEEAVRLLVERGVPEPAARAAVRGRGLTNRIVQEAQEEGLPLEGRGEYFPRVTEASTLKEVVTNPRKGLPKLVERLKGMVGGRDPHAEARTLAPDLGVEELARLKEQGADIPSYRQDFAIPLAVRNQRAKEALAAHKSIREGFQRFGQGLDGRTPEQLAQEGMVAVKYVPKNSNQPFQFARSAMPDDPENWAAVPQELVNGLQRFHKQFVEDEGLATIGAVWKALHRPWKASVTVFRPAFYLNNGLGGMANNLLSDVTDPQAYVDAFRAVFGGTGRMQTVAGSISYADAMRMMESTGVIDAGLSRSLLKAPTLAEVTGKKGLIGRAADAGAAVEKFNRASIFFDRLKKGASAQEAALDTLAAHFDYSDEALTEVERRVREYVPFYIWMKNNAEYQAKKFLEKPQVYGAYIRARERLSEGGREERPTYQRNSLPTGLTLDGQEIRGTSNDPIADVLDLLEKPADKLTSAGTPLIKEPLQQVFNKDLYFGRPVSEYPGDVAPFGTGYMNARLAHALKSLGGPFASMADAGPRIAAGQGTPKDITALIRFFVPGIQAVDPNARLRENAAKVRGRLEQTRKRAREQVQVEVKKTGGR